MSAIELYAQLHRLQAERVAASGAAVTEIATLRAELWGPQVG
jgi:hypothetical protein